MKVFILIMIISFNSFAFNRTSNGSPGGNGWDVDFSELIGCVKLENDLAKLENEFAKKHGKEIERYEDFSLLLLKLDLNNSFKFTDSSKIDPTYKLIEDNSCGCIVQESLEKILEYYKNKDLKKKCPEVMHERRKNRKIIKRLINHETKAQE